MPLFDFHCRECDNRFEALVRGDSVPQCPRCGGGALDKLVAAPAPPGQSAGLVSQARARARAEGHFSNY